MAIRSSVVVAMLAMVCVLPAAGQYADHGPVGLENLRRFDLLPYLWEGVQAQSASSYDRTDDNIDRSNYLYSDNYESTMLDVRGPGCIDRLWITSLDTTHEIRFYFDNDTIPRLKARIAELFSGTLAPFLAPLAGYSSGGYFCYVPMPFRERCRIAVQKNNNTWFYYNIHCSRYRDASGTTTTTGTEDSSAVRQLWESTANPNPNPDIDLISGSASLAAGSTLTLADAVGPATVNALLVRIPQVAPNDAPSRRVLEDVRVRMYWDGQQVPAVDAPLGEFFGCGLGEYNVNSLPIRMSTASGEWYRCYFPMPFGSSARIELVNTGSIALDAVDWRVHTGAMPDAAALLAQGKVGYFYAKWHREYPTTAGTDYIILQTAGRGCFVGCVVTMRGLIADWNFLEGDERIHIDGSATPAIYGTGTEDFFNGGWYFKNGPFTRQVHGNPAQEKDTTYRSPCYRFFLSDKIQYQSSFRLGLEHGDINNIQGNYSSVAYYYQVAVSMLLQTDEIDVGDPASEAAHAYSCDSASPPAVLYMRYEGDDPATVQDNGRRFGGSSQFRVATDPDNRGAKLRRRMNYGVRDQLAAVYVDGVFAGWWYDPGIAAGRWRDSDFEVPPALTAGKSLLDVRVVTGDWSEFRYRVYSYVASEDRAPEAVKSLGAWGFPDHIRLGWTNPADPDLKSVVIRCNTTGYPESPEDGDLVCDLPAWPDSAGEFVHRDLSSGVARFYTAFACDATGRYSEGVRTHAVPHETACSEVERLREDTWIELRGKVVTGIFAADGYIYVQDPDRVSGIRVVSQGSGLVIGDRVNVSGRVTTRKPDSVHPSERQISSAAVARISSGEPLAPLAMNCRAVGGGPIAPYVPGVLGGVGINNVGLLAKIAGRVTRMMGYYLLVDDGTNVPDIDGRIGVLVRCPGTPGAAVGDTVSATGVIEASTPLGWESSRRMLRTRTSADLCVLR